MKVPAPWFSHVFWDKPLPLSTHLFSCTLEVKKLNNVLFIMVINLTLFEVLFSAVATRAATLLRHIGRITLTFTFESAWLKTGLKLSPKKPVEAHDAQYWFVSRQLEPPL